MSFNELKNTKLKRDLKTMSYTLIIGIVVLLVSIGFFGWAYFISQKDLGQASELTDLIAEGKNEEGVYTSLTVTDKPFVFAEYDESSTSSKYYFLWSGEFLNVGYLDYSTYSKLSNENYEKGGFKITGQTKRIPADVAKLAIDAYNEAAGQEFLTLSNYKEYIGNISIDTVTPLYENDFQIFAGITFAVMAIVLFVIYFLRYNRTKKILRSFTDAEWKRILKEIDSEDTKYYKNLKLYLTENYVVDLGEGLQIVKYADIVLMYQYQLKQYGITTTKSLILATKDKKKLAIAKMDNFKKRSKKDFDEIADLIHSKNQNMLIGYTKENRKQVKDLYGIKL